MATEILTRNQLAFLQKLSQNAKYVFALSPRWVGFTDQQGQAEAQQIITTFKAY